MEVFKVSPWELEDLYVMLSTPYPKRQNELPTLQVSFVTGYGRPYTMYVSLTVEEVAKLAMDGHGAWITKHKL